MNVAQLAGDRGVEFLNFYHKTHNFIHNQTYSETALATEGSGIRGQGSGIRREEQGRQGKQGKQGEQGEQGEQECNPKSKIQNPP